MRNRDALDSQTRRYWDDIHSSWERAWHGTKANYLESIVRNGLMPSGTKLSDGKTIKPPGNHYQLSEEHFGVANWAKAVFLSPSILYASHVCYSERVISEGEQWCILVKARVKPASYKSYDPTVVFQRDPIDGEPDTPEYRGLHYALPYTIEPYICATCTHAQFALMHAAAVWQPPLLLRYSSVDIDKPLLSFTHRYA